jgi:hypothetical protein
MEIILNHPGSEEGCMENFPISLSPNSCRNVTPQENFGGGKYLESEILFF